jgi:hypothetical protein
MEWEEPNISYKSLEIWAQIAFACLKYSLGLSTEMSISSCPQHGSFITCSNGYVIFRIPGTTASFLATIFIGIISSTEQMLGLNK